MDLLRTDSYLTLARAINRHPELYVKRLRWRGGLEYLEVIACGPDKLKGRGAPYATALILTELLENEEPDTVAELYTPILQDAIEVLLESVS